MGETATVKYVSEELLTNILFDQTYKAVYELKNTVIRTAECNDNNLAFVLAEGCFEKNDTLKMVDELSNQASINEKDFLVNWNIHIYKLSYINSTTHRVTAHSAYF